MSPILFFVLLLLVTFGLLVLLLKPSSTEVAVQQQLEGIESTRGTGVDRSTILKREAMGPSPLVEDVVRRVPWAPAVALLIKQAGQNWRVSTIILFSFISALGSLWLGSLFTSNLLALTVLVAAVALSPYIYLSILREVRFRQFDALLPEAVDLMSRGLRAGHSINAVIEMVGNEVSDPVGIEFRALYKEQTLGLPIREAVTHLLERVPRDDMRFLATAILLQKESGGNLAQILDKTTAVIRERARLRGQLRIYTAQGRITGWILCFAPFVMFALIGTINREYEKILFTDSFGLKMVYTGLALMVLGILAIRKICDVKV